LEGSALKDHWHIKILSATVKIFRQLLDNPSQYGVLWSGGMRHRGTVVDAQSDKSVSVEFQSDVAERGRQGVRDAGGSGCHARHSTAQY